MTDEAAAMLVRFTQADLKAIIRLHDLHVRSWLSNDLTATELEEYERLKHSLEHALPFNN